MIIEHLLLEKFLNIKVELDNLKNSNKFKVDLSLFRGFGYDIMTRREHENRGVLIRNYANLNSNFKLNLVMNVTLILGLTGPWQVKLLSLAFSHWLSHGTHTEPLAYSRTSLE